MEGILITFVCFDHDKIDSHSMKTISFLLESRMFMELLLFTNPSNFPFFFLEFLLLFLVIKLISCGNAFVPFFFSHFCGFYLFNGSVSQLTCHWRIQVIPSLLSQPMESKKKSYDLFAYIYIEAERQKEGQPNSSCGQIRKCNLTKSRLAGGVSLAEVCINLCALLCVIYGIEF